MQREHAVKEALNRTLAQILEADYSRETPSTEIGNEKSASRLRRTSLRE